MQVRIIDANKAYQVYTCDGWSIDHLNNLFLRKGSMTICIFKNWSALEVLSESNSEDSH